MFNLGGFMTILEKANNLSFWESVDVRAHEVLGAHRVKGQRYMFRVWAPNAAAAYLTGDFCGWQPKAHPMQKVGDNGVWEIILPGIRQLTSYKYVLETKGGRLIYKADPYATHFALRPDTASKVYDICGYRWQDQKWMASRGKRFDKAFNIYEVQLSSWRQKEGGGFYDYNQLADLLIKHVKQMGYTHIELMPVSEYPFDGSWGYQVTGFFAPTSRFGTPRQFMSFVDKLHCAGIGVLLDWVPAHFPKDEAGLYEFDGSYLYEYADPLKREHPDWGTRIFDYGKREVASFLISSAINWAENYHIDGLRVDAVASMLYLDYGKQGGQWRPNQYGNNFNLEAIEFIKKFNTETHLIPGFITIAEESTAYAAVTMPVDKGGLGFDYKWNMGWMNDTLRYLAMSPNERSQNQSLLSFSTSYALSENYILPLSHDEVVHGKRSLLQKPPGGYDEKFLQLSAYLMYMYAHPGKKLLFMGGDFAQYDEWKDNTELDWNLFGYDRHYQFSQFIIKLFKLYRQKPAFFELDYDEAGFEWISADDCRNNVYAFLRKDSTGGVALCIFNFSDKILENYRIGVPFKGPCGLALYNGLFFGRQMPLKTVYCKKKPMHGRTFSGEFVLPPYSGMFYTRQKGGVNYIKHKID